MTKGQKRRAHTIIGGLIALLGIAVILVELVLHWRSPATYRIGWATIAIGLSFFWFGWFITRPKSATEGGGFWLDAVERLGAVVVKVRTGRRASDVAFVPAKPAAPIDPMDQDGDLDNPPHLGAAPELPHIPETKP